MVDWANLIGLGLGIRLELSYSYRTQKWPSTDSVQLSGPPPLQFMRAVEPFPCTAVYTRIVVGYPKHHPLLRPPALLRVGRCHDRHACVILVISSPEKGGFYWNITVRRCHDRSGTRMMFPEYSSTWNKRKEGLLHYRSVRKYNELHVLILLPKL